MNPQQTSLVSLSPEALRVCFVFFQRQGPEEDVHRNVQKVSEDNMNISLTNRMATHQPTLAHSEGSLFKGCTCLSHLNMKYLLPVTNAQLEDLIKSQVTCQGIFPRKQNCRGRALKRVSWKQRQEKAGYSRQRPRQSHPQRMFSLDWRLCKRCLSVHMDISSHPPPFPINEKYILLDLNFFKFQWWPLHISTYHLYLFSVNGLFL